MGEVDQQIRNFGSRISLQTQSGEVSCDVKCSANKSSSSSVSPVPLQNVSGVIFGCDSDGPERVMVVQQPGSTPFHTNLKIIKESYIESVSECTPPSDGPSEPLPLVDEQRCRDREERAVRSAQLEAAKIGLGVTVQGQLVFDSLAKTLPCKWQDKTIVVLDEVRFPV